MAGNCAVSTSNGRKGLAPLHPKTKEKVEKWIEMCKEKDVSLLITETVRTKEEQDKLYAQGRTVPGKVVTKAKGEEYSSPHQWGVAVDFCQNVKGQEYSSNEFFKKAGELAKQVNLFWGGDFQSFKDTPHVEDKDFLPSNSTKTLKEKYGTPNQFFKTF